MNEINLSLEEVRQIATAALEGAGASKKNAASVANSTYLAERDGIKSHGLLYVPIYAEHVVCRKVDGHAEPEVESVKSGSIRVDAKTGFAHPAIDSGWSTFMEATRENGVAVMTVHNSYNCGVLGHHSKRIAEEGFLGLCFTHAPASIAPVGTKKAVIGTNPYSIAVPSKDGQIGFVIDQSASVVAKSEILLRSRTGTAIDESWAFDEFGQPTTDAAEALKGTMAPSGGYKGFNTGLFVELMASCLAGAALSIDATPFSGTKGGPPRTGQCFIAFDPYAFSGDVFFDNVSRLIESINEQEDAKLAGLEKIAMSETTSKQGVMVSQELVDRINAFVR